MVTHITPPHFTLTCKNNAVECESNSSVATCTYNESETKSIYNNRLSGKNRERLVWMDALKCFLILGVIFVHTPGCPAWWTSHHVNYAFFFISGLFFKNRPWGQFIKQNIKSLIIPFLAFYLLSVPFRLGVEFWDYRSIGDLTWSMIWDVFKVEARSDYLYANVPLWFIICIFWVRIFWKGIKTFPLAIQIFACFVIFVLSDYINKIPTPFMINNAVYWTLIFGLGDLSGKPLMGICLNSRIKALLTLALSIGIMLFIGSDFQNSIYTIVLFFFCWCIALESAFSFLKNMKPLYWISFIGTNTLIILGTHLWILTPLQRIQYMLTRTHTEYWALLLTALCIILLIPVIKCSKVMLTRIEEVISD